MKNKDVVNKILAYHPTLLKYEGCDGYKCGNPEDECKGVAVALVPTADVIRRAADAGCNLVVTHEPIFYTSLDAASWIGDFDNKVYEEKQSLIAETGMTVWRDHDHMHAHVPDSIFSGVIRELGWEDYYIKPKKGVMDFSYTFEMPPTKVGDIAKLFKEKLNMNGMKYMGDLDSTVTKVALIGHLIPGFGDAGMDDQGYYHDYAMEVMKKMEQDGVELIIPGEIIEWTVIAYVRDAIAMGKNMACLNIGHYNLEELGMKDFADRIRELLADCEDAPEVSYVPTQDGFLYI